MINVNEHKKILEQIAELEKRSINYFDVEKEFFLIDSDNLSQVRPRLYGYSIQASGIYEDDNLTPEAIAGLDGRGCYVYVDVREGKITIKQDLNGCWGIYLFRHGDYFALSNSFFRLLDHVKFRYPLTVNRDYCHYIMINDVSSHAYSETAVNEIYLVERNAILQMDIKEKNLQIELIDYREYSICPDSEEAIAILDNWIEFWSNVLKEISKHTKFITADLSGGFDSRIALVSLLHSGIDLNKIRIFSIKDELHTHKEDYEIASQIAEHYGFKLNQPLSEQRFLNYSFDDAWNVDLYHQQTFRNLPTIFWAKNKIDKCYYLKGCSGEVIRKYWHMSPEKFLEGQNVKTNRYSPALSDKLFHSIKNIIESAFCNVRDKYKIENTNSIDIPQFLYKETRCRHHFGKETLGQYLKNTLTISPIIDPELWRLQLNTSECPDYNLLIAIIFIRYAPDLLNFPFNSKRSIAPETIEYAKKINERFPLVQKNKENMPEKNFHLQPCDLQTKKILTLGHNNSNIPGNLPEACLKAVFESSRTFGLFTAYFDAELYHHAASYYTTHVFGRSRPLYSIVGVTRVLEDVEISQRNRPLYQDVKRFLKQDFTTILNDDAQIIRKFSVFFTARIDLKLLSSAGDFQILSVSDVNATIAKPKWFQNNGIGYVIRSYVGKLEIIAKTTADGQLYLWLRGKDVRAPKDRSKRIPYWIDYTKLTINGNILLDKLTPVWHDKPCRYMLNAKVGEEIKIQVEWQPHRGNT